ANKARTHNAVVAQADAVIDEVGSPKGILTVDATINAGMPDYLAYIQDSPVQQMIGGITDESRATGNARLGLKLTMPLSHMIDTKVSGKLQFQNDDIALLAGLPPLNNSTGALEFSERGFNINNVHS